MLNNDLTPTSNFVDQLQHSSDNHHDYYEALTPSNLNGMLSPLNKNHVSDTFSQSYNQQLLKQHLQESLSLQKRNSNNQLLYEDNSNIRQFDNNLQQQYHINHNSQNATAQKKTKVYKADQIIMKSSNDNNNHHKSFSSHQLQHSLSGSGSTQPFSSPKKKFSSAISSSSNNNVSQMNAQFPTQNQELNALSNLVTKTEELIDDHLEEQNDFVGSDTLHQPINTKQMQDTQQMQHTIANGNALNYQTASFGSNLKSIEKRFNKNESKAQIADTPSKATINDPMYGTFTDLAISNSTMIISNEIKSKLLDTTSNWKVRTEAIDEVLVILQQQMTENSNILSSQAEQLIEYFIQLLNDQNFKIVLTTLMIINKLLSLSLIENNEHILTSQQMSRFVAHFIKKLGDSKNIIRQEAVRALITIYEVMRRGEKAQNNLVALILPYLNNSSNWHIREELLNVFILCFLKSRNFYEFDSMQIIEAFVLLLNDQKDKVRMMAKEALATYSSIGNKFSFKEIIFQICEPSLKQEILERLDQDMIPFINQEGALELPYLEFIDNQVRDQTVINSTNNGSQFVLPNLSRRESMSSNTQNGVPPKSINSSYQRQPSRGNSSGRRIVPPSANSMANYANQNKRTVSANNIKFDNESYYDQSPAAAVSNKFISHDKQIYQNNTHFGFLPSLNKAQSQQYHNNSYNSQNTSLINNQFQQVQSFQLANNNAQPYLQQLKMQKQMHSDHQVYSATGQRQHIHSLNQQNSFKIPQSEHKQQTFGNLHKGVHSANAYQSGQSLYNREDVYQQNQGFLDQLQQNQSVYDQNQPQSQQQYQQTIAYSAQKSRMTPYESQQSQNMSQQQSRAGTREGVTPIKKQYNQNTFYSDGSFTTTTTSIPDKIKQMRANKSRFNIANINDQNKRNIHIINNNSLQNAQNDSTTEINNTSQSFDIKNNSSSIIGGNQRGPIRAHRHVIQQQQQNLQQDSNTQATSENLQDLCIDNRKIKKKSNNKNTDLQEILEETKAEKLSLKKDGSQMRRTNFGQTDFDDSQQKYLATEDLEPLDNPEKELKKALNSMLSSDDWLIAFEGCCIVRRICKHHSSLIVQQSGMIGGLISQIIKIADSLRSSLSKIALITINDMFTFLKRCMEPQLDALCKILLKKSSDTNSFINEAADKGLQSMCQNCQDTKVLQIILQSNVNAKANTHRQKVCKCLQILIKVLGNSILFFKENDKLIGQLANYLSDACPEVRSIAKQSFIDLSQSIMGQNDREKLLQRVLNEFQLKKVKDLLDKEPAYLSNNGQLQSDFVIINANSHYQQNKKTNPSKQIINSKGQLRSASLNKSNIGSQGDQLLNIQATKIIKPSQIKKRVSQDNVSNITPQKKDAVLDQFFIETLKDLILQTQIQDWKTKLDSVNNLYDFMNQNIKIFQTKSSTKFVELSDTLSSLMSDQNAKIQQQSLDQFLQILPHISFFVEQYIVTFYQALTQNLASSNTQVRKLTESILTQMNEQVTDKTIIMQPLISQIQFSSNARLKPLLIDQLSDMIPALSEQKQQYINKTVLPMAIKLLDDNRTEVKSKTEKLLKAIYQSIGQQMLDSCPQPKLQRLCDIVLSNTQINNSGIATFGAQTINGLLKGAYLQ